VVPSCPSFLRPSTKLSVAGKAGDMQSWLTLALRILSVGEGAVKSLLRVNNLG